MCCVTVSEDEVGKDLTLAMLRPLKVTMKLFNLKKILLIVVIFYIIFL